MLYSLLTEKEKLLRELKRSFTKKDEKDELFRKLVSPLTEKDEKEILLRKLDTLLREQEILSEQIETRQSTLA